MIMKKLFSIVFVLTFCLAASAGEEAPYEQRRTQIYNHIGENIAIIKNSGRDYTLSMNVNWNYYYLTGDLSVDGILVLNGKTKSHTIYREESRFNRSGRLNQETQYTNKEEFSRLGSQLFRTKTLWVDFSSMIDLTELGRGLSGVEDIRNIAPYIHEMRTIKDEYEMDLLKHAIESTASGLVEVFKAAEPGMNEKDFELILNYCFQKANCPDLGFGIQAASGPNATHVHYGQNDRTLEKGDMMVFDVGARYGYYTADISRSFPVSGKFTTEQREIYQLVLDAQKKAISMMEPGVAIGAVSNAAVDVLNEGLAKLGLITDLNSSWQKRFWIQHGFFHHIGLAVHDVGGYGGVLKPGMILTMEPGLYFPENYLDRLKGRASASAKPEEIEHFLTAVRPVFEKYINIGVRIEDDVYITKTGNQVISKDVPKEIDDLEKIMKEKSFFNYQ